MSEPSAPSERTPEPLAEATEPARGRRSRWLRVGLPALVGVLLAVVFGVTTATADLSLGPHQARYDVTTDSLVTVDLGPLGTLELDSPLPLTLGVHVTVEEIPDSFTAVDAATTLQALSGDLQGYLQFFAGPRPRCTTRRRPCSPTRRGVRSAPSRCWRPSGGAAGG